MPDYTIPLQIRPQNGMQQIGDLVNMARWVTALQRERATIEADIAQRMAESQRSQTEASVAAGTAQPRITQAAQAAQQSEIQTNLAKFRLTGEYAQRARDIGQALVSDPDVVNGNAPGIVKKIAQARQMMIDSGVPADVAEVNASHLMSAAAANPQGFRQVLLNSIQAGLGSSGQAGNIRSAPITVSNQQVTQAVETNPFSAVPAGQALPGTTQQQQLPPTAQRYNPETRQMEYVGPTGGPVGSVPSEAEALRLFKENPSRPLNVELKPAPGVPAAPPLGAERGIAGTVESVNKDWADTLAANETASRDIGVLQNIKQYAPGAVTGVASDRRSLIAGLAGLLGMSDAQLAKTETDKLAKNSNMLALAGGNTDLARTLAEMANPNNKMTPEAIKSAADQVIAQKKLVLAKQAFLQPFKALNDPDVYSKALTEFNRAADPRILQLADMTKEEKQKMKASMSENERREFGEKIRKLQELGILK